MVLVTIYLKKKIASNVMAVELSTVKSVVNAKELEYLNQQRPLLAENVTVQEFSHPK